MLEVIHTPDKQLNQTLQHTGVHVQVYHPELDSTAFFPCSTWLTGAPGSATNNKVLPAAAPSAATAHYRVTVLTGDVRGAGTDSDVYLTVHGSDGSTGEHELASSGNNFERNGRDEFTLQSVNIGTITAADVRLSHCLPPAWRHVSRRLP